MCVNLHFLRLMDLITIRKQIESQMKRHDLTADYWPWNVSERWENSNWEHFVDAMEEKWRNGPTCRRFPIEFKDFVSQLCYPVIGNSRKFLACLSRRKARKNVSGRWFSGGSSRSRLFFSRAPIAQIVDENYEFELVCPSQKGIEMKFNDEWGPKTIAGQQKPLLQLDILLRPQEMTSLP